MRAHWSRFGFILASVGSAVGLGNIWRFPYIVGQSGGGAFFIPYFIAIIFFCLPLILLELACGRYLKTSLLESFRKISKKFRHVAWVPFVLIFALMSYYFVVTGWTFAFFLDSVRGTFMSFSDFSSTNGSLYFFILVLGIVAFINLRGIKEGIEKAVKVMMPALFIILVVLLFKALTLPNASDGLSFYLSPDLSLLSNPKIWLLSFAQALFSLSVGFGIYLTFGSYLGKKEDSGKAVFWIVIADTAIALVAGFIIFPIVFSFGFSPTEGVELAFVTLPAIFSEMAFGRFFGSLFFLLLFFGAITSAISMMEVCVSALIDRYKFNRRKVVMWMVGLVGIFGIPSALSYTKHNLTVLGKPFLDLMDSFWGSTVTPISAAVFCLFLAWLWDKEPLTKHLQYRTKYKIPKITIPLLRYVIPTVLLLAVVLRYLNGA